MQLLIVAISRAASAVQNQHRLDLSNMILPPIGSSGQSSSLPDSNGNSTNEIRPIKRTARKEFEPLERQNISNPSPVKFTSGRTGQAEYDPTVGAAEETSISYRRVTPQEFDFTSAPRYRKTAGLDKSSVEFSGTRQEVMTMIDGIEETRNIAEPGDAIITGPKGERYVLTPEKFSKMYEQDPNEPNRYRAKNVIRAIQLSESVELVAPWGEIQKALPGGRIAQAETDETDVYLIEREAFEMTYGPDSSRLEPG
ncbi:MAG: PGDYG domain-containing protein [Burkholderiales bacterium]|nr:PGDYG domain-containing protein [Burkholderiales bacterium]